MDDQTQTLVQPNSTRPGTKDASSMILGPRISSSCLRLPHKQRNGLSGRLQHSVFVDLGTIRDQTLTLSSMEQVSLSSKAILFQSINLEFRFRRDNQQRGNIPYTRTDYS
ncbi:hypothetical protein PVK06_006523 [Gossypium arboreum]|uniref:Uncharacterized protein n=1 Tax=Gossypium arboreum TaxID=29729 RepID=A0ABR0QF25_GOSAR|nr:hypothetical protein PVK06_006523 [Gossypium arboreum]